MNTENIYCVYAHVNKINGKIYIGQSSNILKRWRRNGGGYKTSRKFNNAIRKYGWESFEHIIIENNISQSFADSLEKYLIKTFETQKYGYNIRDGSSRTPLSLESRKLLSENIKKHIIEHPGCRSGKNNPMYGKSHSIETKKKIGQKSKGRNLWWTEKRRKEKSESLKGCKNPNYGKHLSEETKQKLRDANKRPEYLEKMKKYWEEKRALNSHK